MNEHSDTGNLTLPVLSGEIKCTFVYNCAIRQVFVSIAEVDWNYLALEIRLYTSSISDPLSHVSSATRSY